MCRYAAYLGPPLLLSELIYKPANSLVHQASDAMQSRTRINADGFGVGWYAREISPEPAVFRDISPVWNNYNLGSIADKILSRCIVAHVRAAKSYDPVTLENCHPFRRARLLWMHNGDIPGRARLSRLVGQQADDSLLAMLRGNTDSEMALTLFLTHLERPLAREPALEELAAAMRQTLRQIRDWHREADDARPLEMNFCVTSGSALVTTRFALNDASCPSLHWRETGGATGERSVWVASEPLDEESEWRRADNGDILLVGPDLRVERRRLDLD